MFEITPNLHTFWIKDKVEYPETVTKALKKACFHFQHLTFVKQNFFGCHDSHQKEIMEQTGHKQHILSVTVFHNPQMRLPSFRKTSTDSTLGK